MFPLVRKRTTDIVYSTHIHNSYFFEHIKNEFIEQAKINGVKNPYDIKVIGIHYPKSIPETGGYYIEKSISLCILPTDTWSSIIEQILYDDITSKTKRIFKHSVHSINFGIYAEYCKYNKNVLDSSNDPYKTLPDNIKLFIQQIVYIKGKKNMTITRYKCRCIKCYPNLICCDD